MSVAKLSKEPDWLGGNPVHDVLRKSMWFVVDQGRGRLTTRFDPGAVPDTWIPAPGPARGRTKALTTVSSAQKGAAMVSGSGLRQAVYYDEDAGALQPAGSVLITWQIWDSIDHSHYGGSSTFTDENGYFTAPCVDYNMYAEGDIQFTNPDVNVLPYGYYGEGQGACTSDFAMIEVPRNSARVYRNMQVIIPAARAYFSPWTRGPIHVNVGSYSISSYQRGPDEIQIAATGANRAIFNGSNGYGGFTQAHEFGHAFHHKALGGIADNGGGCPSPHFLFGGGTLGCAFREGFADYFSVAAYPSGGGSFPSRIESNAEFTGGDGSIVEGAFAAFLLDLSDPSGEAHDAIQVPGGYVAQTIKSCEVDDYSWPFPIRANGTDHFVYCFERNVDTSLWPTYFSTRGGPTQTVSPGAATPSSWNFAAIRSNWLWNIYKQ